jgi:SAM-dependent methyltransferase
MVISGIPGVLRERCQSGSKSTEGGRGTPYEKNLRQEDRMRFRDRCRICGASNIENFCTAFDRILKHPGETWHVLRCRECGFGWTSPALPVEKIPSYYPREYLGDVDGCLDEYSSGRLLRSRSWRGEIEKVRLVERFIEGGRILDVGCGAGQFLWALDSGRWDRMGVELSAVTVELVRRRIPSLRLISGDIFTGELIRESFDVVTFWHVLEHLPQPEAVIERATALLNPNGWLFLSLPNLASLQARFFRKYWYPFDDVPRHLYHFSERALDLILGRAGLEVRRHLLFSPLVNFHSLKHSLIHWSEDRFRSRIPYYAMKPLLLLFPLLERASRSYGILTTVAQKA